MMLGILLLAFVRYTTGSRSIVKYFETDLEFKNILAGNKWPDDSTIRSFRRRHVKELSEIFSLSVHLGNSLGMNDFGSLAVDGTKVKAYASLYETKNKGGLQKSIQLLSKRMGKTLARLNAAETQENDCYYCPAGQVLHFTNMVQGQTSDLLFVYENKIACAGCPQSSRCIGKEGTYRRIYRDYREMLKEKMRKRLVSNEGYLQYAVRSYVVKPAFGNIKQNRGFRQFYYRGLEKVITEWKLMCAGVNFSKIIAFLQGKDWKNLLQEAFSG